MASTKPVMRAKRELGFSRVQARRTSPCSQQLAKLHGAASWSRMTSRGKQNRQLLLILLDLKPRIKYQIWFAFRQLLIIVEIGPDLDPAACATDEEVLLRGRQMEALRVVRMNRALSTRHRTGISSLGHPIPTPAMPGNIRAFNSPGIPAQA